MSETELAPAAAPEAGRPIYRRITALFIAHFVLGMLVPATAIYARRTPYVFELAGSLTVAQFMLLAFWVGMGVQRRRRQFQIAAAGCVYLSAAEWIAFVTRVGSLRSVNNLAIVILTVLLHNLLFVAAFVSLIAACRRKIAALEWLADPSPLDASARWTVSMRQLFAATFVAAVIFGIARYGRVVGADLPNRLTFALLFWVATMTSALCGAWATLAPGRVGPRIAGALVVNLVLGVTVTIREAAHIFTGMLISIRAASPTTHDHVVGAFLLVPAATIFAASLLVIRSCGYRLVPARAADGKQGADAAATRPATLDR